MKHVLRRTRHEKGVEDRQRMMGTLCELSGWLLQPWRWEPCRQRIIRS